LLSAVFLCPNLVLRRLLIREERCNMKSIDCKEISVVEVLGLVIKKLNEKLEAKNE
jgi:hypothetical protein